MFPLELTKIIQYSNYKNQQQLVLLPENFAIFSKITSTNSYLLEQSKIPDNKLIICIADQQTKGRGRLDRSWDSPVGNVYLSMLFKFNFSIQHLAGLNIMSALAVVRGLNSSLALRGVQLKWPNDILYQQQKLAGILIESHYYPNSNTTLTIIGVGLNVLRRSEELVSNQLPAISLQQILNQIPDRNIIIGNIIAEMLASVDKFKISGLNSQDLADWHSQNYNLNQIITVKVNNTIMTGINTGINLDGNLLLKLCDFDDHNKNREILKLQVINSGEIINNL